MENDRDDKFEKLDEAIEANPEDASAHLNRGIAYQEKGDYDSAIADFDAAIRLDPGVARSWFNRGFSHYRRAEWEKAISDCSEALRLEPEIWECLNLRGDLFAKKGELDQAIKDYTEAIRVCPEHPHGWCAYGPADKASEDLPKIRAKVEMARASIGSIYHNRAVVYARKGDNARAISDLTEVTNRDPDFAQAWLSRGSIYKEIGETDKAEADYQKVEEIYSKEAQVVEALTSQASEYLKEGDYFQAIEAFSAVISKFGVDPGPWYNRGNAYSQKGDYARAIVDFNEAIHRDPDFYHAWNGRGMANAAMGDLAQAISDFSEAVRIDPECFYGWQNRSIAYNANGNIVEAQEDLKRARELGYEGPDTVGS